MNVRVTLSLYDPKGDMLRAIMSGVSDPLEADDPLVLTHETAMVRATVEAVREDVRVSDRAAAIEARMIAVEARGEKAFAVVVGVERSLVADESYPTVALVETAAQVASVEVARMVHAAAREARTSNEPKGGTQ